MATLTPKQERFVREYLVDLNTTQAAIRTGYSKKTAYSIGQENLKKPEVAAEIKKAQKALAKKAKVTAESVIAEMGRIAFANMQDYLDVSDPTKPKVDLSRLTPAQASVIAEATVDKQGFNQRVKIKLHDKLSALTQLGMHLGLFKDRHEHTGADGEPIQRTVIVEVVE